MKIASLHDRGWVSINGGIPILETYQISAEAVVEGSD